MKTKLYIFLFLALASACTSVKKSMSNHTFLDNKKTDSTFNEQMSEAAHIKSIEQKDTAVGIPAKSVSGSLSHDDAQVKSAVTGRKMPVYHSKRENGLEAWVAIDTNGNINYGANADSMTILIKGLTYERDSFWGLYKSAQLRQVFKAKDSTDVRESKTLVEKRSFLQWMLNNAYWVLPVLFLIYWLIKKYFRW